MTAWFLNELIHAGSEHLDSDYVARYDDKAVVDPAEDLDVLRTLGLNERHTFVDFGAGTGTFALAAAPLCRRVIAIDVSPAMVNTLRQRAAEANLANIEVVHAGFLSYQHLGEPVDFVYTRHALHHLPDFWKAIALQRIAAILKPGGVLYLRDLIYSFSLSEAEQVLAAWLGMAPEKPERGWSRAELETHVREEHSTFSWLLEPMIEQAGFRIHAVSHGAARIYSAYTCIKQ
jgi:SAM-dependent methyltransferase